MNSEQTARPERALVIGAGSAIAKALIAGFLQQPNQTQVIAVSREQPDTMSLQDTALTFIRCDYSSTSIRQVAQKLADYAGSITRVFICTGVLHTDTIKPEKRVEDIDAEHMAEIFRINSITPALWLQALLPLLKNSPHCVLTVLSARVGSISDNRKGGWYSYRASKAALNMLIKTAAIEYARRAPGVKLLAFHPGTVDTELSRPFQKNVAPEKLFTPAFVASKLIALTEYTGIANRSADGDAAYLDWAGETIEW